MLVIGKGNLNMGRNILLINTLTYRVDAFVSNLADFLIILTFSVFVYSSLDLVKIGFGKIIFSLVKIAVGMHFLYSIVYIINDFIDYDIVTNFDSLKYSFYKYRPVIYFKRGKSAMFMILLWYLICVYLILSIFEVPLSLTILFVLSFVFFSIIRSLSEGILRFAFFGLLRFFKYICLITLLNISLLDTIYNDVTGYIILWLILPYVAYNTVKYSEKLKTILLLLKDKVGLVIIIACLLVLFSLSIFSRLPDSTLRFVELIAVGYILIIIPGVFASFLPVLILRVQRPNFQHYLLNLAISLIITFFWCIFIGYCTIR